MNFKTLSNCRQILSADGTEYEFDFSDKTFDSSIKARLQDVHRVTQFEVGHRCWDKLASKYYNSADHADKLYKFNEYSNPFSVEEGDIILIPKLEDLELMIVVDTSVNEFTKMIELEIVNPSDRKVDSKRQTFLRKKDALLPPTFSRNGSSIKRNDDGSITLSE